jgi:hypothetical protein
LKQAEESRDIKIELPYICICVKLEDIQYLALTAGVDIGDWNPNLLNIDVPKIPIDHRFQNLLLLRLMLVIFKEKIFSLKGV